MTKLTEIKMEEKEINQLASQKRMTDAEISVVKCTKQHISQTGKRE